MKNTSPLKMNTNKKIYIFLIIVFCGILSLISYSFHTIIVDKNAIENGTTQHYNEFSLTQQDIYKYKFLYTNEQISKIVISHNNTLCELTFKSSDNTKFIDANFESKYIAILITQCENPDERILNYIEENINEQYKKHKSDVNLGFIIGIIFIPIISVFIIMLFILLYRDL